ncbi:FecR domain-containing protein [Aquimarina addita]|uniref:FecR domain-containing protein n=1 Tax=Aquimarina addita TaxID=870485 RepID=A0ABP6USE1_9FLAO
MLTEEEKYFLKYRIKKSVVTYRLKKKRRNITILTAAAAAIVFFIIPYTGFIDTDSEIEKYVNATDLTITNDEDVQLVLSNDEAIHIEEKTSNITYSSSGASVQINGSEKVTQNSESKYNTIIVPYGKRTKITLSEGTKVWLNSGSKLTYPVVFNGDVREVYLMGEAIFDVTHNKEQPFYVKTSDYDVKVLGTVFNVSSYDDDKYTSTALERGSVEIQYSANSFLGKSKLRIIPGTLAMYDNVNEKLSSKRVDVAKYMSWRDGKFILKKQRLDGILKKLSRYYNIEIAVDNQELNEQTFSGHLDLKDTIEKVLDVIKETSDLKYKIVDRKIVIN